MQSCLVGGSVLWLAFGNLNNGANAGLSYLNGNNGLTNANWNYLRRISIYSQSHKNVLRLHILAAAKIESKSRRLVRKESRFYSRKEKMKKKCKNVDITDFDTIRPWVEECIMRHKKRYDFRDLLHKHGLKRKDYYDVLDNHNYEPLKPVIDSITNEAVRRIKERSLDLPPVRIREQRDHTTNKIRMIGCESPMQQIFDYIAVYSCKEIWDGRIVPQQVSSMPDRGQVYGMNLIRKYIKQDERAVRWAKKNGRRYTRKCRYFVKLDIKKCFPNADREKFLELFEHDCGNETILWLWRTLLSTHETEEYHGLMIGALISQWACQYMLSFIYRRAMELKNRDRRLISKMVMFMDDMLLLGSNRSNLFKAVHILTDFSETISFSIKPTFAIVCSKLVGIDMMGFVVYANGKVKMRDRNYIKSRRLMLRYERNGTLTVSQSTRLVSFKGFYKYSDYSGDFHIFKAAQYIIGKEKQNEGLLLRTA